MRLDAASCYLALRARDARFDGTFFVAVTTTGIYCRPICPARVPAADRCQFFTRAAEAEKAGFRACFRCRPELAPGVLTDTVPPVDAITRLVRAAAARIEAGYLNDASVDELAGELGVSSRHLRRAMEAELGVAPVELAQTKRLAMAKHLLQETNLPLTDVAFAAGFASIRRFNALFKARFGRAPTEVRRHHADSTHGTPTDNITLRLDYRPPLDWDALLGFLARRAIPGVEQVTHGEYRRGVSLQGKHGWLCVRPDMTRNALRAKVSLSLAPVLTTVVARLRALFDLDANPTVIAEHLRQDPVLARSLASKPGLRVPGSFDGFEMAVRAILGQQVSVAAATTLSGRVVQRFGKPPSPRATADEAAVGWEFPSAARLAKATVGEVAKVGLPGARARTLIELARAVVSGEVSFTPDSAPDAVIEKLVTLPGIGQWTAHCIALRALRWPDAFPAADWGVRKALGVSTVKEAEARAARWQPWRGYAVLHLWSSLATGVQ
ncbi:MAG: helix-turn-helix domain-containing protein [Myxococcaceae bacterium]|nr:helix-turn-helix domain-containing protein [Myxococcaceae bacterium]